MSRGGERTEAWPTVALGDVAEMCLGKMLDAQKNKGRPQPYLRNPNVRWFDVDLSDVQTAAVLGCSAGTVRSLVSRGMQTLREELEGKPR